jgi:hypothetical protein
VVKSRGGPSRVWSHGIGPRVLKIAQPVLFKNSTGCSRSSLGELLSFPVGEIGRPCLEAAEAEEEDSRGFGGPFRSHKARDRSGKREQGEGEVEDLHTVKRSTPHVDHIGEVEDHGDEGQRLGLLQAIGGEGAVGARDVFPWGLAG